VEEEMEKTADEVKRLQSCINDLISVLALAAIWSGSESSQMLGTLLDSLLAILRLDFAGARLNHSIDGSPIEVVRLAQRQHLSAQSQEVGRALGPWLSGDQTASRLVIPNPAGQGEVTIASFSLGLQDEIGVLVAGSRRADFPTDVELVLLRVAANQAAIGLQEARRSGDQRRISEALERRVAERTSQLTAVNEELRRSESYLAEAQRLAHTGSWAWRLAGENALHLSEEWYRIYGFDPEEGLSAWEEWLQRIHPEDRAKWQEAANRAIGEKSDYEVEVRVLLPDGTVKYILTVGHPVLNAAGDVVQFVGTSMDVTERKRAEEALREQASLLNLTHDSIFVRDMHFVITYWNHAAEELYGWLAEEAVGKVSHQLLRTVFPVPMDEILEELLRTGRWEGELGRTKADGTRVIVASRWSLQRDSRHQPVAILETNNDVTERKRAAETLRQAQEDLAYIARVTTMGELTASLAHEVNQPIAAAVTNAHTCLRWLTRDQPDVEEARAAAMRIVKDGTRAGEIISRIRLLFKKGTSKRELVDVNEVIQEMIVVLRSEAMRHSISIRTELAADLPQVLGDRVQLQQVLMNLTVNSIDAMKDLDGTRELAIRSQTAENKQVLVSVSDTGVGLPRQQIEQIFNAFFTTKPHGTGMGLRISRSIIEAHGGRLWAADNSPRGASFYLTLPSPGAPPSGHRRMG
jgi:PAS domain S-box-containing protein